MKGLGTCTPITRKTWLGDRTALGRRVPLMARAGVVYWVRKNNVRRPKRLLVQPQGDLRLLGHELVLDREIRRDFRESTSGSPAARQERLK
jgi:hypothetical protein